MTCVFRQATAGIEAEWRLKVALSAVLIPFFCIPYFALQRIPIVPVRHWPLGQMEEAVGFHPEWVWVYQSAYLLIAVVPWFITSSQDLWRYARGFVLLSCIGFACFLFFPLECPRPSDAPVTGMYGWLVSYDRPLNTLPSLHVGLSVYTMLVGARLSRGRLVGASRLGVIGATSLWVCAIGYAAVATRQHFVVDLPAGAGLAWASYRWAMLAR